MVIQAIIDNVELVKLCHEGFGILREIAKYIGVTKEEDEKNKRLSPIVLLYSNALTFMDSAFNDALAGRYPSSVVTLRASFETHLAMEKLIASTEDEFSAWANHKDPQNRETFRAYWKIFSPNAIMRDLRNLNDSTKEKYKRVYHNLSPYSHAGVKSISDNIVIPRPADSSQIVAFSPFYQKDLTERQLKDLLVMMWLNGSTISRIFEYRIPRMILEKADKWGNNLEAIGMFG